MFREEYPIAWSYHRNTSRWPFNVHEVEEDVSPAAPFKEYPSAPFLALPRPEFPDVTLQRAIAERLSCRRFSGSPLSQVELSTILMAAYGRQDIILLGDQEHIERPVPSGGGLYPLELYLLSVRIDGLAPGIQHFNMFRHGLEKIRELELPYTLLADLFLGQPYVAGAACVIIISAAVARSLWKYTDRGYRYILFEAGHVAQNINLMVTALGLGSFNIGGFFDDHLANLLNVPMEEEIPLYAVAIGRPKNTARGELRMPDESSQDAGSREP